MRRVPFISSFWCLSMPRVSLILACVAFPVLLAACGEPPENVPTTSNSVRDIPGTVKVALPIKWDIGKAGGTWYDTFADDIRGYNHTSNLDGSYTTVSNYMFEYYFDYDTETREWKGRLFRDFKVVTDEKTDTMTLTATLNPGVMWSDGIQVTADDVAWTWNSLDGVMEIAPREAQGQLVKMPDGSKKRITAEVIDTQTVRWNFPRIVANPNLMVNGEAMPRHIWEPAVKKGVEAVHAFWGVNTPPDQLVGNGPFLLESYKPGERVVFKRNPHYWQKDEAGNQLPYIEKVILSFVPDPNAELLKFQKGDVESHPLQGKDMATLLPESAKKGYSIWNTGPAGGYNAIIFNENPAKLDPVKLKIFTDVRFRQAISSLIDRKTLVDQIASGLGDPLYHIIAPENRYYNAAFATTYSYNPEKAKTLLDELGLKDSNGDGLRETPNGKPFSFSIMVPDKDPQLLSLLNIIINDLKLVGLKATVIPIQQENYAQRLLYTFDWEATLRSFSFPTFQEQWTNVWPSEGDLHFWNPKQKTPALPWEKTIDDIQFKLRYTYDPAKVKPLYEAFQKTLMDNLEIIPLYRRYSFIAVWNKWGNVNVDSHHDLGDGLRRIYVKNTVKVENHG